MATSQFILYSSSDPTGPGPITGTTGSLITILDAILVNGYPGKAAAGWQKFNSGMTGASGSCLSAYRNVSGSGQWMVVNDTGFSAGGKEASITGWENLVHVTSSVYAYTGSMGTGYGQFPANLGGVGGSIGRVNWRKSATLDTQPRNWWCFADAYTMYFITAAGDGISGYGGSYHINIFGDIYSLVGKNDAYRSIIQGQFVDNSGQWWNYSIYNDFFDAMHIGFNSSPEQKSVINYADFGPFMSRTFGGLPGAIQVVKHGDNTRTYQAVTSLYNGNSYYSNFFNFCGQMPCPNGTDQALYISPVLIGETNGHLRGRMRGWFFPLHAAGNFSDGQIIQGTGDYAGKTFMVMKNFGPFGNPFFIEISPTVETN